MQARDAFVRIDVALRVDRLDRALLEAAHAGIAAFSVALQPVEHPQAPGNRQRRAQRAQVAAEEAFDEQPGGDQRDGKQHEPPFARSEEHTSELQSLMRLSYAVFCLKKKNIQKTKTRKREKRL